MKTRDALNEMGCLHASTETVSVFSCNVTSLDIFVETTPFKKRRAFERDRLIILYWLVVLIILKNISQWEGLSHILWKKQMFQTTKQYIILIIPMDSNTVLRRYKQPLKITPQTLHLTSPKSGDRQKNAMRNPCLVSRSFRHTRINCSLTDNGWQWTNSAI